MIGRWLWVGWVVVFGFGCGEVRLNPFVPAPDAGTELGDAGEDEDGGEDGSVDDDDGGIDDDDGGVDADSSS
jgi:hypothetical protein